jgi:hypothetical protein
MMVGLLRMIFNLWQRWRYPKGISERDFHTLLDILQGREDDALMPVEAKNSADRLATLVSQPHAIGITILGSARHFSKNIFSAIKSYAAAGVPTALLLDKSVRQDNSFSAIEALLQFPNVAFVPTPRPVPMLRRLAWAAENLPVEYLFVFTPYDQVNRRSLLVYAERAIAAAPTACVFTQPGRSCGNITGDDLTWRLADWDVSGLSGLLFRRQWLADTLAHLEKTQNVWLAADLLSDLEKDETASFTIPLVATYRATDLTIADIAALWHGWRKRFLPESLASEGQLEPMACEAALAALRDVMRDIGENRELTLAKNALLLSFCAQACALCAPYLEQARLEEHKYLFSAFFNFDQLAKKPCVQALHRSLAEAMIPVRKNCLAIVETEHMEDLKEALLPMAREKHEVIYLTKPQYYDYHYFNCMVLRWQLQPARLVVSSNDMHAFITGGKPFLALWHGLGMLKEIATPDRKLYPIHWLVASSAACVPGWSKSFALPKDHILPLGQIQTDRLFDADFVAARRKAVRAAYGISPDAKVAFFAPTFRLGEPKYYDFGLDIDDFAEQLANAGIYLLAKRHHVFASILRDKGQDTSGLRDSQNGFFRVDEEFDFVSLLCAADVFMTDYSSGLFYAAILNMPFVLYAIDTKEYARGPNGFMIRYPVDLPGEFVGRADAAALAQALAHARERLDAKKYAAFREHHVGACDGHVSGRVLRLLDTMLRDPQAAEVFATSAIEENSREVSHAA